MDSIPYTCWVKCLDFRVTINRLLHSLYPSLSCKSFQNIRRRLIRSNPLFNRVLMYQTSSVLISFLLKKKRKKGQQKKNKKKNNKRRKRKSKKNKAKIIHVKFMQDHKFLGRILLFSFFIVLNSYFAYRVFSLGLWFYCSMRVLIEMY